MGVQFFSINMFLITKLPTTDNHVRKIMIGVFLSIFFLGKAMESFQISSLQEEFGGILVSIGCGIAMWFVVSWLNGLNVLNSLRYFVFRAFLLDK